jgi:hypothetical protein
MLLKILKMPLATLLLLLVIQDTLPFYEAKYAQDVKMAT